MKTRGLFIFSLLFILHSDSVAQQLNEAWAKTAGGSGDDVGSSVVVDHQGGIYVAGTFKSALFTIGSTTLINAGGNDIFIAKYDTAGNFLWAQAYGGAGNESVSKIYYSGGALYMADSFSTNISIGSFSFVPSGGANAYLAKLSTTGTVLWVNQINSNIDLLNMSGSSNGCIYLAGTRTISSSPNGFVYKYSSAGTLLNALTVPNSSYPRQPTLVSVERNDNVSVIYHNSTFQSTYVHRNRYDSSGAFLGMGAVPSQNSLQNWFMHSFRAINSSNYFYSASFQTSVPSVYMGDNFGYNVIGGCNKTVTNMDIDHLGNEYIAGSVRTGPVNTWCDGSGYTVITGPLSGNLKITGATGYDIYYCHRTSVDADFLNSTKLNGNTNEFAQQIAVDTSNLAVYVVGSWSKIVDTSRFYFGPSILLNAGNGATSDFLLLKLRPQPSPLTVNAGIDRTICFGGSTVIGNPASGGTGSYTYSWAPAAGLNSTTIATPTANPITNTSYVVTVTDASGTTVMDTVLVTINTSAYVPTISLLGLSTNPFCEGETTSLTASAGTSFLWSNGETTQSVDITEADTLTVTVTSNSGCIGTSLPYIVSTKPRTATPVIQVNGSTTMCQGDSRTLTAISSELPATYSWSNGQSTQSINVTSADTYNVRARGPNGCLSLNAGVTINVNALPAGVITAAGSTTICSGDSLLLTAATAPGNTIVWNNGATTNSIWVKTAGAYFATITSSQTCSAVTNIINVTVITSPSSPTVTASGPLNFCNGGSVILTAQNSEPGISYLWNTGSTNAALTATLSGNYTVIATNSGGCTSAPSTTSVTVYQNPTAVISAGSNTNFCNGDSVQLSVVTAAGNSVLWSNGSTGSFIWVKNSGSYSATVTSLQGCTGTSNVIQVTAYPLPLTPTINASGPTAFCSGGNVTLTAQSTQSAISWLWNTGSANNSLLVSTGGNYSVKAVNVNGCSSIPAAVTVVVHPLPAGTVSANGATTRCSGDSVQLTVSTASGNNVVWNTGVTSSSIWVFTTGVYSAQILSAQGCSNITNAIPVAFLPLPSPAISQTGNVLTVSPPAQTYQWFFEGNPINGATSQSYTMTQGGSYSVTVTENGCPASDTLTAVQKNNDQSILHQVYPNPSSHDINIVYTLTESQKVSVRLYDVMGQRVFNIVNEQIQSQGDHNYRIKNSSLRLQAGYYIVEIIAGEKRVRQTIIIQ